MNKRMPCTAFSHFGSNQWTKTQKEYLHRWKENKMKRNFILAPKFITNKKTRCIFTLLALAIFVFLQLSVSNEHIRNLINRECTHWSDVTCTILLWKGKAINDLPKAEKVEATVVISYCGEDMSVFRNYIDDKSKNITIRNITLISRCAEPFPSNLAYNINTVQSTWKKPELNFIEWILAQLESAESKSLPEHYLQENHVILFLWSEPLKRSAELRTMDQVIQSTFEDRFGCLLQPPYSLSYYHGPVRLRKYANPDPHVTRRYKNFGEWIDRLDLSWIGYIDPSWMFHNLLAVDMSVPMQVPVVPVCYGSSFAIKSRDLSLRLEQFFYVLKGMEADYQNYEYHELTEFMERSFAALFSQPLAKEKIRSLRKFSTNIHSGPIHTGSLAHRWRSHPWLKVFTGDLLEQQDIDLSQVRLTLVVAYCMEDMTWMNAYFKDLNIQNVTIISKCIEEINGFNPPGAKIWREPNVGRCDHSYARWMADMKEEDSTENHIVLFIKASRNLYQTGMRYRPIQDLIRIAIGHGFSCEAKPHDKSIFYRTAILRSFQIAGHKYVNIKSQYDSMGQWLDAMEINFPNPLTPVCYGGNFAVKASQIYSRKALWNRMITSLARADSIEEGHFAERAWAGILSYPLNSDENAVMQSIPIINGDSDGVFGGHIHVNEGVVQKKSSIL